MCTTTSVSGTRAFVEECWGNDAQRLRSVAAAKLRTDWLQVWWCKKFNRPMKDPLLQSYTLEEIQVEYFMEWIESDPMQAFANNAEGVQFRTGDGVVDKWEEQIAAGENPDFDDGVDPEFLEKFISYSKKTAQLANPWLPQTESGEAPPEEPVADEDLDDLFEDLDADGSFTDNYED